MERLKCAVVGTGIFGEIHCDVLAGYERAELVTICDMNEARAKKVAADCKTAYTTDFKQVAANKDIDAVLIATPDFAHRDVAMAMIEAGKNVMVEKPLATSVAEAEEIVGAARKQGITLMTDFHNRFNPPFVITKERIDGGELGKLMMINTKLSDKISVPVDWFSWSGKSGPQWFLFPHIVDLCCWLNGGFPKTVYARGAKEVLPSKGVDCYDVVSAMLDFGGSYAVVETSWILPDTWTSLVEFVVDIQTSAGKVHIDLSSPNFLVASDTKKYLEVPIYFGHTPIHGQKYGFFSLPTRHFVDCVLDKKTPIISPADGLNNVKVIAAIMKSVEEGKAIPVDL